MTRPLMKLTTDDFASMSPLQRATAILFSGIVTAGQRTRQIQQYIKTAKAEGLL